MLLPSTLSLAQLVERFFYMEDVVGSNPAGKTNWEYRQGLGGSVKPPLGGSIPSAPTIKG